MLAIPLSWHRNHRNSHSFPTRRSSDLEAKKFMDDGKPVADTVILSLIKEELAKPEARQGAVFDGFPRTAPQAELVDRTLAERGQRLNHILLLDVPEEELIRRLMARAAQEGRSDDTPEAVGTRGVEIGRAHV